MDARDRLREYLEQRRELGESEFVLDGLSVDESLSALGVRGGAAPAQETPREARASGPVSSSWREALRSVGVDKPTAAKQPAVSDPAVSDPAASLPAQAAKIGRYEMPAPTEPSESATGELKQGIVVGHKMEAGGALANLESIDAIAKAVAA